MKHIKVLILLLMIQVSAKSQDTTSKPIRVVVKPALLSSMQPQNTKAFSYRSLNDSMALEIGALKSQNDSFLQLLNDGLQKESSLRNELEEVKEINENYKKELELSRGKQLQTSHTSSILLIFNVIAGIILLITIFWFYARKKTPVEESEEQVIKPAASANKDFVETRMERIEKLGRLRDKGLLTEEEFQMQKKQILD
jgi:Short C-terminal domain